VTAIGDGSLFHVNRLRWCSWRPTASLVIGCAC